MAVYSAVSGNRFSHDMVHINFLFPKCLKINVIFCFDVHKQNKTKNHKKLGLAVQLKWAKESWIEKWAESSRPRTEMVLGIGTWSTMVLDHLHIPWLTMVPNGAI